MPRDNKMTMVIAADGADKVNCTEHQSVNSTSGTLAEAYLECSENLQVVSPTQTIQGLLNMQIYVYFL